MKNIVKFSALFLVCLSVFTSCATLTENHYKREEFNKVSGKLDNYVVYVHDASNTYRIDKPKLTVTGIKGQVVPITDVPTIKEIKNPHTQKELRKHKHDLNLYTKTTIDQDSKETILKNVDISDIAHVNNNSKVDIAGDIAAGVVLSLGAAILVGTVYIFKGAL